MSNGIDMASLRQLMNEAKRLARQYRTLTGKPLGITGEVGELCAAELLGLQLADVRCPGYDATDSDGRKIQIKTRCILPGAKPGQRLGRIKFDHPWDSVILVLLDEEFEPLEVYTASRDVVEAALKAPGSRARNEQGALGVNKFKRISKCIWPRAHLSHKGGHS
jgi:hypothetical protein